ncbi:MAG: 1,4-dihydroxy-2-naphthoate octaprenyltransferase [Verrucomicrobiales bacterium]|nr:1,4-dihydroxy-2-naphthoate octaprenyltransferase [Verrucomicrobiales bacterium]
MREWVLAARPKTLPAAVVPVWVGCVLAYAGAGVFDAALAICTVASAMAIQVATNFFNDALDFQKGADTAARVGPRRITAGGGASARGVLWAGVVVLVIAVALSVPMGLARGWVVVAIGVPSLYFSYGYTGGPVPLAYRGLGELFVVLFFGLIAVTGTVFIQTGEWMIEAVVLGGQVGALSTVLIAVNNLRDVEEDCGSGKRTLAVRFGVGFGRAEIVVLCLVPHLLGVFWLVGGDGGAFWWPLGTVLLGGVISLGVVRNPPGAVYNRYLALGGGQMVLFAILYTVGLL